MKTLSLFSLIFILTFQKAFGQVIETSNDFSSKENYNFYSLKQKKNKTTALVLLGAGTIIVIGNYISYSNGTSDGFAGNVPSTSQIVVFGIGGASVLASIPFFISAGKNKMRANMSIKTESMAFGKLSDIMSKQVSLSLVIDI